MINFFKKNYQLLIIFLLVFFMYFPSLSAFYTNDDFYFLKISDTKTVHEFVNYFNIFRASEGLGIYRPLTTQVYYSIAVNLFDRSPLPLHILSFGALFSIIYLIYKLVYLLLDDKKTALIAALLYATSATHFAHLYYLATFQELGMTIFVLLSCIHFMGNKRGLAFLFFILAMMSKETAVVTPLLIALVYIFKTKNFNKAKIGRFTLQILPYLALLAVYLFIRFRFYGIASGDTYVWDFSIRRFINTLAWYLLWGLNLPETILDFVGPGLHINPNLLLYWSKEIIPIMSLFVVQLLCLLIFLIKSLLTKNLKIKKETNSVSVFSILWFVISLLPVAFLPMHKFAFYLTLPLIGLVIRVSYLIVNSRTNKLFTISFLVTWVTLSVLTLNHTKGTSWITRGEEISQRVMVFMDEHKSETLDGATFTDNIQDLVLPWSPSQVVKVALSDKNFFYVFYPQVAEKISYYQGGGMQINSRQFLKY